MSLIAEIEEELAVAMRERDAPRRDTLRLILSNLRSAEKELQRELNDQEELQVLQRERKRAHRGRGGLPRGRQRGAGRSRGRRARRDPGVHARAPVRGGSRVDHRRRDRRVRCDEHARPGAGHGRRDAAGRGSCRRVGGEPARPREAGLSVPAAGPPRIQVAPTSSPRRSYRGKAHVSVPDSGRKGRGPGSVARLHFG